MKKLIRALILIKCILLIPVALIICAIGTVLYCITWSIHYINNGKDFIPKDPWCLRALEWCFSIKYDYT